MAEPVAEAWEHGDPYEQYVGRWSRKVASLFLSWLNLPPALRWLDLGCGTGALAAGICDQCKPASVFAVEPSEGFLRKAGERLGDRVVLLRGSATEIPLADHCVDVTVSALVLNFLPDRRAALAEMARVSTRGGTIAAYVWDYAGKMELMTYFWDAAVQLDPGAAKLHEAVRFPECRAEALTDLWQSAGLRQVAVSPLDISTEFASFADYWLPFLGGQGPAPAYAMSLEATARTRLRDLVRSRLPQRTDGSISLSARAWGVRGTVAG